jgi:hypothetical protein
VFGLAALIVVLAAAGAVAAVKLSASNHGTNAGPPAGRSAPASSAPPTSASPSLSPTPGQSTASGPATVASGGPASVVQAYYAAINNHDCNTAWRLGGDNISAANGQSYQQFCQGFSNTSHDDLTVNSVAGNTVTVTIVAQNTDGSSRSFYGSYVVRNGTIESASIQAAG